MTEINVQFGEDAPVNVQLSDDAPVNVQLSDDAPVNVQLSEDAPVNVQFGDDDPINVVFEATKTLTSHAATHLFGGDDDLISKTWGGLANKWTTKPTLHATTAAGRVFLYTYGSTIYYRLVPAPYDSTLDSFYTTFSDPTLTGLVATRGASI